MKFDADIQNFVERVEWVCAKTYADTWPHHYIVKDKVDTELFHKMVLHIRQYGYWEDFYARRTKYFEQGGLIYWTMVYPDDDSRWYPPEEEDIINRCSAEDTYEKHLKNGTLPA